jgi:hypothetical protein
MMITSEGRQPLPFLPSITLAYHRYWERHNIPWHYLDQQDPSTLPLRRDQMDFINSVCPCAGLSMLNRSRTGEVNYYHYSNKPLLLLFAGWQRLLCGAE